MRPRHLALPARLCAGSAASRKLSELGMRGVFASLSINGLLPQKRREDAWALQKSRDCGTKHNGRKFAQARHGEFVLWRTAKIFIDSSTGIKNSLSVIPSEVEESLDIISDTAAWPLAHDYRSLAASFSWP